MMQGVINLKKLNQLVNCPYDIEITGVHSDSRNIKPGYLFVAVHGFNVDHLDFLDMAIRNGAVAVISDREVDTEIPVILVEDANKELELICQKFYEVTPTEFTFLGITGTEGKTTTAMILQQILNPVIKTAYIGTNGAIADDLNIVLNNTTPCTEELYETLKKIKEVGCKQIVIEVSSEALLHKRVDSINFKVASITNITEDHLNIHKTLENYRDSKFHLFDLVTCDGVRILNGDDLNCKLAPCKEKITYGFSSDNDCVISNVKEMSKSISFALSFQDKNYSIESPCSGKYNVYNLTTAFLMGLSLGVDASLLIEQLKKVTTIPGRREFLDFGQCYDIILDYAHTTNGINCLLDSVHNLGYKRIIVVTGAAGGREKEKRSVIGKILLEKSDLVVFTMDDPRYESVDDIIDQMIDKLPNKNYVRIIDRPKAISYAFDEAKQGDVVLIIGKGRDAYMAIEDRKEAYCDYDVIKSYFQEK